MSDPLTAEEQKFFDTKGAEAPVAPAVQEPAAPAAESAPAAAELAKEPAAAVPAKPDTVPLATLIEERKRRQESEHRARRYEERMERILALQMQNQGQGQQPAEPPLPDDPQEAARVLVDRRLGEVQAQTQRQQEQVSQFVAAARTARAEFERDQPDFGDAYNFLRRNQFDELVESGFDPATAERRLLADEQAIIQRAFEAGANPAERLYKLAQRRGYKKAEAAKMAETQPQRIAAMERGQGATQSLASASGTAPARLTVQTLLSMDDADFAKATADPNAWRKLWQ